jgi:hypothetical protein
MNLSGRIININTTHIIKWLLNVQILDCTEYLNCAKHVLGYIQKKKGMFLVLKRLALWINGPLSTKAVHVSCCYVDIYTREKIPEIKQLEPQSWILQDVS